MKERKKQDGEGSRVKNLHGGGRGKSGMEQGGRDKWKGQSKEGRMERSKRERGKEGGRVKTKHGGWKRKEEKKSYL